MAEGGQARRRFGIKVPVLTAVVLVASLVGLQGVSNAAGPNPKKVATVNFNPTSVSSNGSVTGATIFVRNDNALGTDIGIGSWDADLSLFTSVTNYSTPNGWALSYVGGHLRANGTGAQKLLPGESMTVTLDLTAGCTLGTRGILVYSSTDWTNQTFALSGDKTISVIAGPTSPTKLKVTGITVPAPDTEDPPVAGPQLGNGQWLIEATGTFNVTVEVQNNSGGAVSPCSNVTVSLLKKTGTGTLGGTTTGTITTSQTSTTISGVTYSKAENGVQIQADDDTTLTESTETGLLPDVLTADFLTDLAFEENPDHLQAGGTTTTSTLLSSSSTDGNTCQADSTHPTCVFISTPLGTGGADTYATAAVLSCSTLGTTCKGLGLAFIASDKPALLALYDNSEPNRFITLTIVCDRTACGGGGISNFTVDINAGNGAPTTPSPACTTSVKNFVDPPGAGNLGFCTDYSASRRDGSQDLILVVRLAVDATGRIH